MTEAHVPIPTFRGRIGRTLAESEPRFAERPHPGVGRDHGSAVSDRYAGPFPFSGTLHEVEIRPAPRTRVDNANTARAEMARQ